MSDFAVFDAILFADKLYLAFWGFLFGGFLIQLFLTSLFKITVLVTANMLTCYVTNMPRIF